jgi:hypothetical protein
MRRSTLGIVGVAVLRLIVVGIRAARGDAFVPATQPAKVSDEDAAAENTLKKPFEMNLPSVKLQDAIDFLRDISNQNIYVDWSQLKLAGVTQSTAVSGDQEQTPLSQCIQRVLAATGSDALEYRVAGGVVFISTKLDFQDRAKRDGPYLASLSDATKAASVLNRRMPSVQMPGVPLTDMIDFLRDITGATIEVRWGPLIAAGVQMKTPVTLGLHDTRLETILNLVLDQVGEGKLGFTATPVTIKRFDRKRGNVTVKTALITISTIEDLTKSAVTRPSIDTGGHG